MERYKTGFRSFTLFIALSAILLSAESARAQATVVVDGTAMTFTGQPPVQRAGRIFVPLRGVLERLGATVSYFAPTKMVTAVRGDTKITLPVGSQQAFVNDRTVPLDAAPFIVNGSVLVPLRFVSESLGAHVAWNAGARTVNIDSRGLAPAPPSQPAPPPVARVFTGVFMDSERLNDNELRLVMVDGSSVKVPSNVPVFYGGQRVTTDDLFSGDEMTIPLDPETGMGTRIDIAEWTD